MKQGMDWSVTLAILHFISGTVVGPRRMDEVMANKAHTRVMIMAEVQLAKMRGGLISSVGTPGFGATCIGSFSFTPPMACDVNALAPHLSTLVLKRWEIKLMMLLLVSFACLLALVPFYIVFSFFLFGGVGVGSTC